MKVHQYAEDRPETENHGNVMENFHEPRRKIFSQKRLPSSKRSLDDLDLLRAPGPHDDGVGCVCLVHQLSSPAMRFSGNTWSRSFPQMFCFSEKKQLELYYPVDFLQKLGRSLSSHVRKTEHF